MFNKKNIKELEKTVSELKEQLNMYSNLQQLSLDNRNLLADLKNKIEPKPITKYNYTVDSIEFAKHLQKFNKVKKCGGGRCGFSYQIPANIIDEVANKKEETIKEN